MTAEQARTLLIQNLEPRYGPGEAASIARMVLEDAFGLRGPGITSPENWAADQVDRLHGLLQRLQAGEPVQYVLGQADFFGLQFQVSPAVLIPRQETEELVAWAISEVRSKTAARVLDIGTGSGCIAITLAKKCPAAELWATDLSLEALAVATENAARLGAKVTFRQHDILQANDWSELPAFDLIVSNPPYIPRREEKLIPEHVLRHEPHLALFVADDDPLLFYRTIADFARQKLRPGGLLLFECNEFNAAEVAARLPTQGFAKVELRRDLAGAERMVKAELLASLR